VKKQPAYELIWNGKDLTKALDPYLTNLVFADREQGESDELEFTLDDREGLWRNQYYPRKGDPVSLKLGWKDGVFDPCGSFQIDEIETVRSTQGHFVTIKALSAIITEPLRTKRRARYENITLLRLATTIASKGGMTVSGYIENITLKGIAQHRETDLGFLRRVSTMYGYVFSIKSNKLVFTKSDRLQARASVARISPDNCDSIRITDATDLSVKSVKHTYWDAEKRKRVSYEYQGSSGFTKPDTLQIEGHVSNQQQSELKAKAAWLKANNGTVSGTIEFGFGVSGILAGNNIEIIRMGVVSGLYHISSTRHSVAFGTGARLTADVFKVGSVPASLY